jgi:hypothetical protein
LVIGPFRHWPVKAVSHWVEKQLMGLLATLFQRETEDVRRIKHSLKQITKDEQRLHPIYELGDSIRETSVACARSLKPLYDDGNEGASQQTFVIREFIFFFSHLVSRLAVSQHGTAARDALLPILDKSNRMVFIESFFTFPEDKKQEAYDWFSTDFLKADQVYWECPKIRAADNPSETDTVLTRFATIVSNTFTLASNKTRVHQLIQDSAFAALAELQLDKRVDAAVAILV